MTYGLQRNNIDEAICKFDDFIKETHRIAHTQRTTMIQHHNKITILNDANIKFKQYCEYLKSGNDNVIQESFAEYQSAKKKVTHDILRKENERWRTTLQNKNSKDLWSSIDWKGNMSNKIKIHPTINELKSHLNIFIRLMIA